MVIKHLYGELSDHYSCFDMGVEALRGYYPLETTRNSAPWEFIQPGLYNYLKPMKLYFKVLTTKEAGAS